MKFTDASIKGLKSKSERYEKWETNGRGFGIRVSPAGTKTFLFMYRFNKLSRRMTLGKYPTMKLSEAGIAHAQAREKLDKGIDPGREKVEGDQEEREAITINGLAQEYIKIYAKPKKKTWDEDQRMLNADILPRWKNRKAADIRKRDVVKLLDTIIDRGSLVMANRTFRLLRTMFTFAVGRDVLDKSPCVDMEEPNVETPRERVLDEHEIKKTWFGLDKAKMSEGTVRALRLLLLTGQRNGEVVGASWGEFDLEKKWWTIPGARTKNKKIHRVFLTDMAMDTLSQAKDASGESKWIFPSIQNKHITTRSLSRAVRNNSQKRPKGHPKHSPPYGDFFKIENFTPHDFRRTVSTLMAEAGVDEFHVSKVLNHTTPGITGKVYNRYKYDVEKQQALETWERKLKAILFNEKAKILNLKR